MMIEQYAVALWFRWVDDLEVSNPNAFQIFNLRSNAERKKMKGLLGDRNLECHFVFGGT
jgi:protein transport protein SEC24